MKFILNFTKFNNKPPLNQSINPIQHLQYLQDPPSSFEIPRNNLKILRN